MELITILEKTVSPGKAARVGPGRGGAALPAVWALPPTPLPLPVHKMAPTARPDPPPAAAREGTERGVPEPGRAHPRGTALPL